MADAADALGRAKAAMGAWFGRLPEADCAIVPVPDYLAADAPAAYYFPPAGDGSRPGTYYVNTHAPDEKSGTEAESIGYHEAIPGHHLQLAIAAELTDLPDFQRFGFGNTAYVEGWALYTERLAEEMGLYGGDLDRLGMLTADAWRAGRLVVDTGLHALGWTRRQAIDFLLENTPAGRGRESPSRSTATSACPARPWPTRPASGSSSGCEPPPRTAWVTGSTSRASTTPCWPTAR